MKTEEFNGAKNLLLKVQMSKGKGDLAWQHTQLFRTNLEGSNENSDAFQFRWIVHLKKDASQIGFLINLAFISKCFS